MTRSKAHHFWKCADAVCQKLSKLVRACQNYILPKLARFLRHSVGQMVWAYVWYSQDIFVPLRHSHWDRERIRVLKSYPSCCLATLQDLVALCHSTWYKNLGALVPNPLVIGRMGRIKLASPSRLFLCQIWSFYLKPWACRVTKIGSAVSPPLGVGCSWTRETCHPHELPCRIWSLLASDVVWDRRS